jgi:hypothetical protein
MTIPTLRRIGKSVDETKRGTIKAASEPHGLFILNSQV